MSRTATTWRWIIATLSLALLLAALDLLIGCSSGQTAARTVDAAAAPAAAALPPAPPPADTRAADEQLAAARDRLTQLERERDAEAADIRRLERVRDHLADEAARARLAWTAGLLIAAGIGFGVLVFVLPMGRRWPMLASVGSFAGAALALILRAVYAWLVWIGAALGLGFVAYAAWQIARHRTAAAEAAGFGSRLEAALRDWSGMGKAELDDLLATVKEVSAASQARAGVGKLIAAIRGKPHKPPVAPPPAPPAASAQAGP